MRKLKNRISTPKNHHASPLATVPLRTPLGAQTFAMLAGHGRIYGAFAPHAANAPMNARLRIRRSTHRSR